MERMFDIEKTINDIKEYAELLDKYRALEEKNKKLTEKNDALLREKATLREYCDELDSECDDLVVTKELLEGQIRELTKENEKLKEIIKDHQFYEEKLEHRIIEFEELLHGE